MTSAATFKKLAAVATIGVLGSPALVHAVVVAQPATTTQTAPLASTAAPVTTATSTTKAVAAAASVATKAAVTCANCGTVQEVVAHKKKGKGSGLGLIAGAVVGGVVGNQFGKGTGNTVTTVGGAVAGGVAGNEIEKSAKKHTEYVTKVKMDDGTIREFKLDQQYAVGARVTVDGDKVQPKP